MTRHRSYLTGRNLRVPRRVAGPPPRIPRTPAPAPSKGARRPPAGPNPLAGGVPRIRPPPSTKPAPGGARGPRGAVSRRRGAGPCDILGALRDNEEKMGIMYAHASADPQFAAEQAALGQYQADAAAHAAGLVQAMTDRGCP